MTHASIMMAAGGTGGHLFPAQALAEELMRRGYEIDLITDTRGHHYGTAFPARQVYKVPSRTFTEKSPMEALKTFATLSTGFQMAYRIIGDVAPKAIIGFGGYPALPPISAARLRRVPIAIHEQNAVMGRANRFLAPMAQAIATSFDETKFIEAKLAPRIRLTGTPLRDSVTGIRTSWYNTPAHDGQLNLLVFGGSQGARFFSDMMPAALTLLPEQMRDRMMVVQQCRAEDLDRVFDAYEAGGVAAELGTFFADLPQRMAGSHLVISRAGATTVAELAALGRPALLVPLPGSIDGDQRENAARFVGGGAGWMLEQDVATPEHVAGMVRRLFDEPAALSRAAAKAQTLARTDAVTRLADLMVELATGQGLTEPLAEAAE